MEPIREAEMQTQPGKRLNEESKKSWKGPLLIACIVLAVLLAAYAGLCAYAGSLDTFYPNRHINGIDVGGLTVEQAQQRLERQLLQQAITLVDNEGQPLAHLTVGDLGYTAEDFSGDAQFWKNDDQNKGFFKKGWAYLATVTDSSSTSYTFGKNMDQNFGTTAINEYAVDVTWEVADKTDIGVDMRLLNNKLNLQFDYFKESREGIYLRRSSIPSYVGMINNPYGNIGKVENKGFELSVNYANSWGGDWSLSLMGNYSFNRNKVLEDDSTVVYPWQNTIGNKVGQRFGLVALGLFESYGEIAASPVQTGDTRPGDIKYKDINGDGKIDEYDKVPIGWGSVPEIMYGFGFSVGWKNLSLTAMFQGAAHVDAMLSGEGVLPFSQGSSRGNLLSNITDRWTEENPRQNAFYPRLSIGNINMNYEESTWWLKDTDYLRLKNIELSYRLPDHWMKRIHLDNARIFIQGVNLLTFSSFKIWDVELGDGRGARYPNIASVSLGVNFNF